MNTITQLTGNTTAPLLTPAAPEVAPKPSTESEPKIQFLATYEQRIKERERPNMSMLKVFHHEALDMDLFVGPMKTEGYNALENVEKYGLPGTAVAGQKISSFQEDDYNRQIAYLTYGVYFQGPQGQLIRQTRQQAVALLDMEGAGPSNRALISAIRQVNPPKEMLHQEMVNLISMTNFTNVVLWTVFELGLGKAVLHHLAPSATPEEKEWAEAQLKQVEEVMLELGPIFEVRDNARRLGLTPRDEQFPPVAAGAS